MAGTGAAGGRLRALGARILVGAVRRVPRERAMRAAAALGRGYARLGMPRTSTGQRNLRLAFPDWRESQRRAVLERSLANLGRCFVEFASQSRLGDAELRALAEIEGIEHVAEVQRRSPTGSAVCMTAHLGNWELLAAIMAAHGWPISVVVHGREDPHLDALVASLRARPGVDLLTLGAAARGSLRALRDGRFLAVPIDQNAPRNEGIFVPFFGRMACTRDGPARLALRTGAPVLMVFIERIGEGPRHRVRIEPPIWAEEPGAGARVRGAERQKQVRALVARATARVEAAIRRAPDQWIWTHRRWRTQPVGEARPYPPRRRSMAQLGPATGR